MSLRRAIIGPIRALAANACPSLGRTLGMPWESSSSTSRVGGSTTGRLALTVVAAQGGAWQWRTNALLGANLVVYPSGGACTAVPKAEQLTRRTLQTSALANASSTKKPDHGPPNVPEAVLRHAYMGMLTGNLPDDGRVLTWLMWWANRLGVPAIARACLAKLRFAADGGKLTVQDLVAIINLPPSHEPDGVAVLEQQVARLAGAVLASQLRQAHEVLQDKQLLGQFVQLPFELVKYWVGMDKLETDSENTVAVLITAWYDHQMSSAPSATAPTKRQCKELSALLRVSQLTSAFHLQALTHLKWYRPSHHTHLDHHVMLRMLPRLSQDMQAGIHQMIALVDAGASKAVPRRIKSIRKQLALAAAGGAARRIHPSQDYTRSVSHEQLATLRAKHDQDPGGVRMLKLGQVYYAGYDLTVSLSMHPPAEKDTVGNPAGGSTTSKKRKAERCQLGLNLSLAWPIELVNHGVSAMVPQPVSVMQVHYEIGGRTGHSVLGGSSWSGSHEVCGGTSGGTLPVKVTLSSVV